MSDIINNATLYAPLTEQDKSEFLIAGGSFEIAEYAGAGAALPETAGGNDFVISGATVNAGRLDISNNNSSVGITKTLYDGIISENLHGGAIFHNKGELYISGSTFHKIFSSGKDGSTSVRGSAIYSTTTSAIDKTLFSGNTNYSSFGTIFNQSALSITGSTFYKNVAVGCGAIYSNSNDKQLNISQTLFYGNTSGKYSDANFLYGNGGAIGVYGGEAIINASTFSHSGASLGGAVYTQNDKTTTIRDSDFFDNHARSNGGALHLRYSAVISGSTFFNSTSGSSGGAIYIFKDGADFTTPDLTLTISETVFSGNSANYGGAIQATKHSAVSVSGSTFHENSANNRGGAISANYDLTVEFSYFSGNDADDLGGAVYHRAVADLKNIDCPYSAAADRSAWVDGWTEESFEKRYTTLTIKGSTFAQASDEIGYMSHLILDGTAQKNIFHADINALSGLFKDSFKYNYVDASDGKTKSASAEFSNTFAAQSLTIKGDLELHNASINGGTANYVNGAAILFNNSEVISIAGLTFSGSNSLNFNGSATVNFSENQQLNGAAVIIGGNYADGATVATNLAGLNGYSSGGVERNFGDVYLSGNNTMIRRELYADNAIVTDTATAISVGVESNGFDAVSSFSEISDDILANFTGSYTVDGDITISAPLVLAKGATLTNNAAITIDGNGLFAAGCTEPVLVLGKEFSNGENGSVSASDCYIWSNADGFYAAQGTKAALVSSGGARHFVTVNGTNYVGDCYTSYTEAKNKKLPVVIVDEVYTSETPLTAVLISNSINLTLKNVTFSNLQRTGTGTSKNTQICLSNSGTAVICGGEFSNNKLYAGRNGTIYNSGTLTIGKDGEKGTLFHGNFSEGTSACIWTANTGTTNVTGATFSKNLASGGIVYSTGNATAGRSTFTNTLFTGNTSGKISNGVLEYSSHGVISAQGGIITFTGCTLSDNRASAGGISYTNGADLIVSNTTFCNNMATGEGGCFEFKLTENTSITDTLFSGNTATYGGAVSLHGSSTDAIATAVTFTGTTFSGNTATHGGALYVYNKQSSATITGCTFTGNTVSGKGGAIYNTGNCYITDSEFCTAYDTISNTAYMSFGGAILLNAAVSGDGTFFINKDTEFSGNATDFSDITITVDATGLNAGDTYATGVKAIGRYTISGNSNVYLTLDDANNLVLKALESVEVSTNGKAVGDGSNLVDATVSGSFFAATAPTETIISTITGSVSGTVIGGQWADGTENYAYATGGAVTLNLNGAQIGDTSHVYGGGYMYGDDKAKPKAAQMKVDKVFLTLSGENTSAKGLIFGGIHAREYGYAYVETVNITVDGGTYGRIHGGGWAEKGAYSVVNSVNINVKSGTVQYIYAGGCNATTETGYDIINGSSVGTANITIDSAATVTYVYLGARYAAGKITGDVTLTVTGDSEANIRRITGWGSTGMDSSENGSSIVKLETDLTTTYFDYIDELVVSEGCTLNILESAAFGDGQKLTLDLAYDANSFTGEEAWNVVVNDNIEAFFSAIGTIQFNNSARELKADGSLWTTGSSAKDTGYDLWVDGDTLKFGKLA